MTWAVDVKGGSPQVESRFDQQIAHSRDQKYPEAELAQMEAAKVLVMKVADTSPLYGVQGTASGWFSVSSQPGSVPEFGVSISLSRGAVKLVDEPVVETAPAPNSVEPPGDE